MFVTLEVRLAVVVAVGACLAGIGCVDMVGADGAKFTERVEKRFTVTGKPDIDLSTFDGAIEVTPWDRDEVLVVVEKRGRNKAEVDAIDVHSDQNGSRISVEVRSPHADRGFHLDWSSRSAKLIVSVPASSNIGARSGDGSIHVRDVAGDLKIHTGDGSVKLEGASAAIDVDTGDGSINASGKFTSVRAKSGDGSVTIHAAPGSAASAEWDISTGDGSVVVELPSGFSAELDAHTGDGSVRLEDITLANVSGRLDKNSVKGTLGSGGRTMRLRTGDGSITLRRF